jgi:hypothetical protein
MKIYGQFTLHAHLKCINMIIKNTKIQTLLFSLSNLFQAMRGEKVREALDIASFSMQE